MDESPNIAGFRATLNRGFQAVSDPLRTQLNDQTEAALREYRRMFGILDAMTAAEKTAPLDVIDSGRIRRIASGSGTTDQEVIQLLFSYRSYCEAFLRGVWANRRGNS